MYPPRDKSVLDPGVCHRGLVTSIALAYPLTIRKHDLFHLLAVVHVIYFIYPQAGLSPLVNQ